MSDCLLLGFPDYEPPARRLAAALRVRYDSVAIHHFPDGECKLRLPLPLPERVILCRILHHPNAKLVELLLAAEGARAAGARRLTLVAPYLCYMRQDAAFATGEVVSQRIVGRWLGGLFDRVVTVDPHLHRVARLDEVVAGAHCITLSAGPLLGDHVKQRLDRPLLVGPDSESRPWLARIAAHTGLDYIVADKQRLSDCEVRVSLPPYALRGRSAVIVDDLASTGRTLAATAAALRAAGAAAVHCAVTHALFIGDAEQALRAAGVEHIASTDSVPHASNCVPLAALLAAALAEPCDAG